MKIAVLSDIHGNLEALQSVWADMLTQTPPPEEVYSLGDNLGYGPDPEACVNMVREKGIHSVLGNHELGVARAKYRKWFNSQSREALKRTCELVSDATVEWAKSLPPFMVRHNCLFVHGLPPDSALTYLYEVEIEAMPALFSTFEQPVAFLGHTHELELIRFNGESVEREPLRNRQYQLDRSERYLINIGAVGQPRDGDNRAKYVLWDTETWTLDVRFVQYDIQAVVRKFAERGMPERYAERLL